MSNLYVFSFQHFKGTVMQIEKALINDHLRISKVSWKFRIPNVDNFAAILTLNFLLSFLFINKTLRLNNFTTRTAMNAKTSVFVICVDNFLL